MPSRNGKERLRLSKRPLDLETGSRTLCPEIHGTEITDPDPDFDHLGGRPAPEFCDEIVSCGQNGMTIRLNALQEIPFFPGYLLTRSEMLDVCAPDAGDDPDVGAGKSRKRGDLSPVVHPDLPDGRLVGGRGREDGKGKADVVVQVAACGRDLELRTENRRGKILCRGLSAASGNHHGAELQVLSPRRSKKRQTGQAVAGGENSEMGWKADRRFGIAKSRHRTLRGRLGEEGVSVEALPSQGDIEVSGANIACVLGDTGNDGRRITRCQQGPGHACDLGKGQRIHVIAPP